MARDNEQVNEPSFGELRELLANMLRMTVSLR